MLKPPIPENCYDCLHYHGRSYHGNILVCAMYPYGQENCPDWEQGGEQPRYDSEQSRERQAQAVRTRILGNCG